MNYICNMVKFLRKLIANLYPPLKWRLPVIILLGVITGMGIYIFYISRAWSYLSDAPETCINCHIMTPEYTTWRHSSHGQRATCNDCHVPQDNFFRGYYFKAMDGLRHSAIFTIRGYDQSIRMLPPGRTVVQENCIRCHEQLNQRVGTAVTYKQTTHGEGKQCWDCHREVPHGRVKSLSSMPYVQVPVPKSPVPKWLQKMTGLKMK